MTPQHAQWEEEEKRGQKWRRLTPLTLVANLATNFVGTGMIIGLLVFIIQGFQKQFDLQNTQNVQMWAAIKSGNDQERNDVLCLTKNLYGCCGQKANASC